MVTGDASAGGAVVVVVVVVACMQAAACKSKDNYRIPYRREEEGCDEEGPRKRGKSMLEHKEGI